MPTIPRVTPPLARIDDLAALPEENFVNMNSKKNERRKNVKDGKTGGTRGRDSDVSKSEDVEAGKDKPKMKKKKTTKT